MSANNGNADRVRAYLAGCTAPVTSEAIKAALGLGKNALDNALHTLRRDGELEIAASEGRVGAGGRRHLWRLTDTGRAKCSGQDYTPSPPKPVLNAAPLLQAWPLPVLRAEARA